MCKPIVLLVILNAVIANHSSQRLRLSTLIETDKNRDKFRLDIKKGCEFISFPNATINECGFCVGGETGLNHDYGKDCKGVCFGNAAIDCMGVCDGFSYVDECTGQCVQPGFETHSIWNASSNRDCRGLCLQPSSTDPVGGGVGGGVGSTSSVSAPMPSQTYTIDQCGICRMSTASSFTIVQSNQPVDCNGNCRLPGLSKSVEVCGQCVRPTEMSAVIDDCGNCISEGHPCSCDRDPTKCGCIDPNNCYVIKAINPQAIPHNIQANVSIVGYFYPYAKQLYCVVRRHGFELVDSFPVQFLHKNKTVAQCNIQLAQDGEYVLGLGFRKNVFITPPKDLLHLYVYDTSSINISLIGPSTSLTNESDSLLTIHFDDLNNEIPPIPIRCKVLYDNGEEELANFGVKLNSCTLPRSDHRSKSQKIRIYPTFDGIHMFSSSVEHLIQAIPPRIFVLSSFVSEDGLSVVINFDKPVDLGAIDRNINANSDTYDDEPLVMCDYLFTESTIEHLSLHGLQGCRWATRVQLIATILRPLSTDTIEVEFKPNVLFQHGQKFALPNEAMSGNVSKLSNWWSYEPMVAITGPNEISACGNFALIGHFSSPRGTHEVDFQWEVEGDVSDELKHYVSRSGKSNNLLLSSDLLEIGIEYTFIFKAFIQVRRQSLQATHLLVKLPYEAPIISLYHTKLLHSLPFYESSNLTLFADINVPDCIQPPQRLVLSWRVSDPMFKFPLNNIAKRFSITYTIDPYTVPANHPTSIMVDSFIGLAQNKTSTAMFNFEMKRAPLKANLYNGITKVTIGSQSGMIRLNSQPEPSKKAMIYQWSCHEIKTAQPCYFNFANAQPHELNRNPLLVTPEMQHRNELWLSSVSMQPNQQYLVGLQLFDANNSKISSETEYTLLNVVEGIKPQVSIGPIFIKEKYVVPYNPRFSMFIIPFGTGITIRGKAFLEQGVGEVRWESTTFRYPLSWSSKRVSDDQIDTQLNIHEDSLMAYGLYTFKMVACSKNKQCSSSEISLMAAQSATMCNVLLDSYVELEPTMVNVEKCNIPPSASPVTYQLYLEDEHFPTLLPINSPQLSPVMTFPGTPAFSENQLNRLAVRVCDRFDTCTLHFSPPISVENAPNLTASVDQLVQRARRLHKIGDPITAFSVINSVFLKPDSFNESYRSYESAINSTIEFGSNALQMPSLTMSRGHYEMILNALSFALPKTNNLRLRRQLLALIVRFYEKAEALQSIPSINSIRVTYSNVMNAFVPNEEQRNANITIDDERYLRDIRLTLRKIKQAAAAQLPLGSRLVLMAERLDDRYLDNEGLPIRLHTAVTEVMHLSNAFDVNLKARLNVNQTVTAQVQFGEEVKMNLSTGWDCHQELPCTSVVYSVTIYPDLNPFPESLSMHKLSPVLDITIHAPKTGEEMPIRSLLKATVFELTVTGNVSYGGTDYITKCHYYDEERQKWVMDDVHPLGIAYNQAGCWSGHLSSFVVMRSVVGLNADYIIGVLVACLMGVLVFGIMVVFYVQRKRENASQVMPDVPIKIEPTSTNSYNPNAHHIQAQRAHAKSRIRQVKVATEIQSQTILVTD
ncbi:hypothetical protein RDWZM_003862 [Blomia tropicalis]|uniref:PKD/REJ-like domain-containing protein n=1 Tax=Blomia tropicalis TaxID=40697 RepID=A0A9Q0MJ19_BLOTA|nr:hypothetical protein RDWZM_003862 [Blomia tropicalis]